MVDAFPLPRKMGDNAIASEAFELRSLSEDSHRAAGTIGLVQAEFQILRVVPDGTMLLSESLSMRRLRRSDE